MTVGPLHDRLMVQRLDEGEQNIGGIIIPDTAKEKPQQGTAYYPKFSRAITRRGDGQLSTPGP